MHGIAAGLLIMVVAWLVLCVMGGSVVANLPTEIRQELAPATPVVGAIVVAIACSTLCWVMPVSVFAVPLLLVGALGLAVGLRRQRVAAGRAGTWLPVRGGAAQWMIGSGLAAALPVAVASYPALRIGSYIASQPTLNNDAFYYVSLSDWLISRTVSGSPTVAPSGPDAVTPGYGPAVSALDLGLRFSQEGVQAFLTMFSGQPPTATWYPLTVLWLAHLPGGTASAFALLRLPKSSGIVAGLLLSVSSVMLTQFFNQNSASLLGLCIAPLAFAGLIRMLRPRPDDRSAWRWVYAGIAALCWAGVVCVYNEMLPLTAGAAGLYALARVVADRRALAGPFLFFVAATVMLVPVATTQFLKQLTFAREQGVGVGVYFYPLDQPVIASARILGVRTYYEIGVPWWAWPLFALVAAGFLLVVRNSADRILWLALPLNVFVIVRQLANGQRWYSQQRAVEVGTFMVLFAVLAGWATWIDRARRPARQASLMPRDGAQTGDRHRADRHSPPHPVPLRHGTGASTYRSAGALALAALTVIATVRAPLRLSRTTDLDHRHVDSTFAQTREWVSTRSADGSGVVVNVTDFYDQAWLAYELRRLDDVGYVSLFPDYLRARSFEGAGEPRWAVIDSGRGEIIGAEPGCGPIEENSRFALIDAVACPASLQVG